MGAQKGVCVKICLKSARKCWGSIRIVPEVHQKVEYPALLPTTSGGWG